MLTLSAADCNDSALCKMKHDTTNYTVLPCFCYSFPNNTLLLFSLQSFVKNVTSRVSGLLPSTITKWFSSPSSSNANGSSMVADASDSSDDEISETPVITQPPAKRMRYNSPGSYSHYGPSEVR